MSLLVPGASDIPALSAAVARAVSAVARIGRACVRMGRHDAAREGRGRRTGLWARVGSTNLNLASWLTNYELDVAVEDRAFAASDGSAVRARSRDVRRKSF